MRHLLPDYCPTCGQRWPPETPGKTMRVIGYRLPKLVLGVGVVGLLLWIWFTLPPKFLSGCSC